MNMTEGMPVGQVTDMMFDELAPYLDEVYAYVFEQIDATSATPQEAQAKKKSFLQKHGKAILGAGLAAGAIHGLSRHGAGLEGTTAAQQGGFVNYGKNIGRGAADIGHTLINPMAREAAVGVGKKGDTDYVRGRGAATGWGTQIKGGYTKHTGRARTAYDVQAKNVGDFGRRQKAAWQGLWPAKKDEEAK